MGLGKTYQAISWLALEPKARPVVVVCPSSLKLNWQAELRKHAGMKSEVLRTTRPYRPRNRNGVWIINYDVLHHWVEYLITLKPKCVIIDECQAIKNRSAKRSKATTDLTKHVPHVLALSGTPINNRPVEFFPVLNILDRKTFRSFWRYAFAYCNPKRGFRGRGWDFSGAANLDELHQKVSRLMIRRTKEQVLEELPSKIRTVIPIEISNWGEYEKARDAFVEWVIKTKGHKAAKKALSAQELVKLGELRRLAARGKLYMVKDWIKDRLASNSKEKIVVFTIHRKTTQALKKAFPKAKVIDSTTPMDERQAIVDRFQKSKRGEVLIGSIRCMGEGLTLTASSTVAFAEVGWTPTEHDQAEDRLVRIGQKAAAVNIYYFLAKDTIEEDIWRLVEEKRDVINQVVEGGAGEERQVRREVVSKLLKVKQEDDE